MTPELILAFISGPVVVELLKFILTIGSKKRDAWRADFEALASRYQADITRLEEHIRHQDERIGKLEAEANEWQEKYYDEVKQRQLLEVAIAAKDQLIETLRRELEKWEASARAGRMPLTVIPSETEADPSEGE